MSDFEQPASQSEEVQPEQEISPEIAAVRESFGIKNTTPTAPETIEEVEEDAEQSPPATEEQKNVRKVKFNKKEVEIPEDQIDDLLERGLALDKERERKTKYESALTRAAKLAGYDKVDDYLTNLDTLEQQAAKQKEDAFTSMRQQLREEAENAGIDPALLDEWLDNNPVIAHANEVLEREKTSQSVQQQQQAEQAKLQSWQDLFAKYPHLTDDLPDDGSAAPWFTPEMQRLVNDRNYDPIDAYRLVYSDKIIADERKRTEQDVIKQQRLNKRSRVEGESRVDTEPEVPPEKAAAFIEFGLNPNAAKKYIKK
ncbi:hypothetical protein [Paenibacillus sp. FSL R7-0333]|uniref:hypothetical protein n=1 Tax=Paenibacillus sp. FSL R7-0333 TaxID=1926587 RepID=UPI00096E65F0|nr:hypothetical protein BK146_17960 [Paenibacillus sp. FSL R7-0333]